MARVLGVLRLSREKDESTSLDRQRAYISAWAEQNGHVIVGWAEDSGVSGSVAPWERPELGQWLPSTASGLVGLSDAQAWARSKAGEWDILCAWRLDRVTRRVLHLAGLVEWANANGKGIVSTSEGFDLSTPMGRIFVQILGALAEGELEAIKERAKSSFAHLMTTGRWRGGFVPYGYRAVKAEKGKGWALEIDPETSAVLVDIVSRIIDGETVNSIVRTLNEQGVPNPLNAQRLRAGKPMTSGEWRVGNLLKMLRSPTLLGQSFVTEKDASGKAVARLVRNANGMPLQRAEPILTRQQWDRLQAVLDANGTKQTGKRSNGSLLLRVAFCACGEPMYRAKGRTNHYYRCGMHGRAAKPCPEGTKGFVEPVLNEQVVSAFLGFVGNLELRERVFVPGQNQEQALADLDRALSELREDRAAGLFSGDRGAQEYRDMYRGLEARREALSAVPSTPDAWQEVPTGKTYREHWESLPDDQARAKALRDAGVRVTLYPKPVTASDLITDPQDVDGFLPVPEGAASPVVIAFPTGLRERVALGG